MSKLEYLVIHCTATPQGREVTAADIRRWHLSPKPAGRGWKQVGYTDMILLSGQVCRLTDNNEDSKVDPWEITNGVAGINDASRHVVYVGGLNSNGVPADTRTGAQKDALKKYVLDFVKKFPEVKVAGHHQFAAKACPSFDVPKWCASIGVPTKNIYRV
jgi:hypothetical protein